MSQAANAIEALIRGDDEDEDAPFIGALLVAEHFENMRALRRLVQGFLGKR